METRVLKLKYANVTSKSKYVEDIKFCGGTITDTVVSLPAKAIYFTITEPLTFMRKFRETRSAKFLLN